MLVLFLEQMEKELHHLVKPNSVGSVSIDREQCELTASLSQIPHILFNAKLLILILERLEKELIELIHPVNSNPVDIDSALAPAALEKPEGNQ